MHHMDRPVTIENVHNMSWERQSDESDEYPLLVAEISGEMGEDECIHPHWYRYAEVFCAAVWLQSMYNVTVKERVASTTSQEWRCAE